MKSIVKKLLSGMGIFITRNQRYDYLTEQIFAKILQENSNCVDIGCHKGEVLKQMLRYSPKGNHYAFEPIPSLFETYLKNQFPENCHLYNLGLSERESEKTFNFVVSNPAYSGFEKRSYKGEEKIELITVQTARLDQILPESYNPDLIKIDVEGAELEVLKGSEKILARCKPVILFEHGKGASDIYGTSPEDIFDLLCSKHEFRIFTLESFLKNNDSLDLSKFKALYESGQEYYFVAGI